MPPNEWLTPSDCIWSDHTYIPGRYPIAGHYPGLKVFFVKQLKVQSPSLQSQIEELQILCSKQDSSSMFSQVRMLLKEISLWKPNNHDVQGILDSTVVPVKDEYGSEKLLRPRDIFAIGDRQNYNTMFSGKIAMLAIPLGEIRSVRIFLSALGLDNRYMSRLASETSKVENAVEDAALSRDFRQRAFALVRYVN